MDRHDVDWKGYFAAAPTPFTKDGELDRELLANVLSHLVDQRAHGVLVNGSTGECYAQTTEERRTVTEVAVRAIAGAAPVLVGTSSTSVDETIALARHAHGAGADGVLFCPPPGARLTESEVVDFYRHVCAATPGPVMAYNIPSEVVTDMRPETIAEVADIPNVVAVKDSTPDDLRFQRTVLELSDRLRVFGNVLTPAGISMMIAGCGGDGHFGSGMPLGSLLADAFDHVWAGRAAEALAIARRFSELRGALHAPDGNGVFGGMQAQLKTMMRLLGQPAGYPRPPRRALEDDAGAVEGLAALLERHGVLAARCPA
ncbi:dihydrodipicolinate synthase family protein [Streptomyces sp. B6B3]|uniref:dihydrodipicolinate synthase family protein n=1 Tax=Streptomyces sp. B6B3 TaxID=3153570 RepID=UPI00325D9298